MATEALPFLIQSKHCRLIVDDMISSSIHQKCIAASVINTKEIAKFLKVTQRNELENSGPLVGKRNLDQTKRRSLISIQEEALLNVK